MPVLWKEPQCYSREGAEVWLIPSFIFQRLMKVMWLLFGDISKSGEGNGNPLQHSCLENSMEWGAWHHWLDGHEFEQAAGVGDGQGSLVCSRLHKEWRATKSGHNYGATKSGHNWATELNGLQSMGLHRVRHSWSHTYSFIHSFVHALK